MKRKPAQRDIDKPEPCYVNYAILRADCELTLFRKAYPNKPISLARIDTHPGCSALWTLRRPTYPLAITLVEQMVTSFPISRPGIAVLLHAINHDLLYLCQHVHITQNQALFLNLLPMSLKANSEQAQLMAFVK